MTNTRKQIVASPSSSVPQHRLRRATSPLGLARGELVALLAMNQCLGIGGDRDHQQQNAEIHEAVGNDAWCRAGQTRT